MSVLPALAMFVVLHGAFFADVLFQGRSLSAATYVAGLTSTGPVDAPAPDGAPHLLDAEGAAWVDEPSPYLARTAFAAAELPLWSPASGLGTPLAANLNSGAGNPLQLPLNLWPSPRNADLFLLARLFLLGCGTWLFLRELGVHALAALLGATVVAYGGYPMAWIAHHPLSTEVFLPLLLLGFERGRRGQASGWALVAIAATGSLLGGKLQATLLCCAFAGAYACVRAPRRDGGAGSRTMAALVVAFGAAGLLAAYLLLPAFELMTRASGLTLGGRAQLASFTVPWSSLASLALPALYVAPGRAFADGFLTPAVGLGTVVLAGVGVVAEAAPLRRVARFCALWAGVLLLRNVGGLGALATSLPGARGILFVKYTFTVSFALAVAAAIGLDAIVAGRVDAGRARGAIGVGLLAIAGVAAAAIMGSIVPTFPAHLAAPAALGIVLLGTIVTWHVRLIRGPGVAAVFVLVVLADLWMAAPRRHPPRLDPYRPPAYVEFLRAAPAGRVIADADLAVPLTSGAAGLADFRAIDVLTPGAYYAFFTRLVSFCDRVIHFTVDPDVALAATAPALDLAGVRWIVTAKPLALNDLATRVRAQVGRERTARLLVGMRRLRTDGGPLAIGPIAVGDDARFAFTLSTPFTLDVTAESEAAELAWGLLVRGAGQGIVLSTVVEGVPSDATSAPQAIASVDAWQEQRVALARAGERRRVRLRLVAKSRDATPAVVSIGNLGFGPGADAETRLVAERGMRQAAEVAALREAFRDPALGVVVYENTNALPRAFRVRQAEPVASEDAALTRLGDGFDFRTAALVPTVDVAAVRAALAGHDAPAVAHAGASAPDGPTVIRSETPSALTIATDGAAPALVVLADLAFPGWHADVDGRKTPVVTVDGVLRGVVVPAGAHVVRFRYRPLSLVLGTVLSGIALVMLVPLARMAAAAHRDAA